MATTLELCDLESTELCMWIGKGDRLKSTKLSVSTWNPLVVQSMTEIF